MIFHFSIQLIIGFKIESIGRETIRTWFLQRWKLFSSILLFACWYSLNNVFEIKIDKKNFFSYRLFTVQNSASSAVIWAIVSLSCFTLLSGTDIFYSLCTDKNHRVNILATRHFTGSHRLKSKCSICSLLVFSFFLCMKSEILLLSRWLTCRKTKIIIKKNFAFYTPSRFVLSLTDGKF